MSVAPGDLPRRVSGKVRCGRAGDLVGEGGRRERPGEVFRARVQESRPAPYRGRTDLKGGELTCSCPDEHDAIGKHTAATLLVLVDSPATRPPSPPPPRPGGGPR